MARHRKTGRIKASYYSKRFRKMIYKRYKSIKKFLSSKRALRKKGLRLNRRR